MTLEKAIEILRDSIAYNTLHITQEHDEAVKLGIEALTYCINVRRYPHQVQDLPIPGETKEETNALGKSHRNPGAQSQRNR